MNHGRSLMTELEWERNASTAKKWAAALRVTRLESQMDVLNRHFLSIQHESTVSLLRLIRIDPAGCR